MDQIISVAFIHSIIGGLSCLQNLFLTLAMPKMLDNFIAAFESGTVSNHDFSHSTSINTSKMNVTSYTSALEEQSWFAESCEVFIKT